MGEPVYLSHVSPTDTVAMGDAMVTEDMRERHCAVGDLHLSVRVSSAGLDPEQKATRLAWQVRSTDPDLPGILSDDHVYEFVERALTAREALRLVAHMLVDAGNEFRASAEGGLRFPLWLSAMAHRHLADLTFVTWTGISPSEVRTDGLPADQFLLAVDHVRDTLRSSAVEPGYGLHGPQLRSVLQEFAAKADRDVTVPHPGDPNGTPLYEGPAGDAHEHLMPGRYHAHERHDPTQEIIVLVTPAPLSGGLMAAAYSNADTDDQERTQHPRTPERPADRTQRPPSASQDPDRADPPFPQL
ncbi:hypothetical protein [Jiangella alba]|nr:hypothetical protein [Jiangella alba]